MVVDIYYTVHEKTWEEKYIWNKNAFIEFINFYIKEKKGKQVTTIKQAEKYFNENFSKEWLDFIIRSEVEKKSN